jgi:threonine aldolase
LRGNFSSDHVTPVCEPIMQAIAAANAGTAASYGGDELTARLQTVASEIFGKPVAIYPVTSGTAANALALSQIAPPYSEIYCYEAAHIITDECGAPEFFTGGARLTGLAAPDGKIRPEQIAKAIGFAEDLGVHHNKPAAISVTQATEWGTVYGLDELAAISEVAQQHALPVHMDGARFSNALAHLNCTPAEATWKSGVDVLSLGATKNGALCADAVVLFDPGMAPEFERRRKRAGHLWSKHRFLSAQLLAYLDNGLWLRNARHANAMAARLACGLKEAADLSLLHPVQANEIFALLPEKKVVSLEQSGFKFYRWPLHASNDGVAIRLVTSYATTAAEVDEFLAVAASLR